MPPVPIEAALAFSTTLDDIAVDADKLYFSSLQKDGRLCLFQFVDEENSIEILPPQFSIGSKLYGYGGRSFEVRHGKIFFIHAQDQGIYALDENKVSLICKGDLFGDILYSKMHDCLFALCSKNGKSCIVRIDLKEPTPKILVEAHDFYANLALSEDEKTLGFVAWSHPHMPWDESYIYTLDIGSKKLTPILEKKETSAVDPYFVGNALFYLSDETGFWNLYNANHEKITNLKADLAEPLWRFGKQRLKRFSENETLFIYTSYGEDFLALFNHNSHTIQNISLNETTMMAALPYRGKIALYGGSPTSTLKLQMYSIEGEKIVTPKTTTLSIASKNRHKETIYSYFHPPTSNLKKPPLIVKCHSGPTSRATSLMNPTTEFFTSRGFAFLETNYGGSSGYGREYRNRLIHRFGDIDVTDCIDAVESLIQEERVDPSRIVIMGSSSGGMTALLATLYSPLFKVAILSYPVLDLATLAKETHAFEKHYFDRLVAPSDFMKRSPLHQRDRIKVPLLLFQGKKDTVTPYSLMQTFYEKVKNQATLTVFEDEGHSFKRMETKKSVLEKTLFFIDESIKRV